MSDIGFDMFFGKELKAKFETNTVISACLDVAKKATIKQAAYIRRTAKSSIRLASGPKDHSDPGKPPKSHNGLLRDFIFFDFDNMGTSVVIGPALLQSKSGRRFDQHKGVAKMPVPQLLEEGGPVQAFRHDSNHAGGGWYYTDTMKPRPYMAPALERSKRELPKFWEQALVGK